MSDTTKSIPVKTIVLGAIFVILGFFTALTFFKSCTKSKEVAPAVAPSLVSDSVTQVPSQLTTTTPVVQEPEVAEVVDAVQSSIQEEVVEPEEEIEREIPHLVLSGVFASETGSYALINKRIVKEGDTILGVKVISIDSTRVELDAFGKPIILRVK